MIIPSAKRNSGIALVIVMVMILVLGVLAGGFAYSMKVEMRLAMQSNNETEFEWLGRSGVELARCLLVEQFKAKSGNPADSLKQKWAGGTGDTNVLPDISMDNFELGRGRISVKIVDAERKFNVNHQNRALMLEMLNRAMRFMGVDPSESSQVVDSILDWTDADSDEGISGTESSYYLGLEPPYAAKNGPVDDITELLFIRGIKENPAMFWGSTSSNYTPSPFMNRGPGGIRDREVIDYPYGLNDFLTPISSGKVNVNTAPRHVLEMIFGNPDAVTAIMTERAGLDGQEGTEDDRPIGNVAQIKTLTANIISETLVDQVFGIQSSVFEVTVSCDIGGFRRDYVALLNRFSVTKVDVLYMYWKRNSGQRSEEGSSTSADLAVTP